MSTQVSIRRDGRDQNILLGDPHVRLLLLPEEEDVEIFHERHEHVSDVLQNFRAFKASINYPSISTILDGIKASVI